MNNKISICRSNREGSIIETIATFNNTEAFKTWCAVNNAKNYLVRMSRGNYRRVSIGELTREVRRNASPHYSVVAGYVNFDTTYDVIVSPAV